MGLDIRAYCELQKIPASDVELDEDGYPVDEEEFQQFYVNPDFPGRADPIDEKSFYNQGSFSMGFRAGSYSGYSYWRGLLAQMAEYGQTDEQALNTAFQASEGPFWELIYFSDCEGVIGSVCAQKLAKDFKEWDEKAKNFLSDQPDEQNYFYSVYKNFAEAMEMASQNGAVRFC